MSICSPIPVNPSLLVQPAHRSISTSGPTNLPKSLAFLPFLLATCPQSPAQHLSHQNLQVIISTPTHTSPLYQKRTNKTTFHNQSRENNSTSTPIPFPAPKDGELFVFVVPRFGKLIPAIEGGGVRQSAAVGRPAAA